MCIHNFEGIKCFIDNISKTKHKHQKTQLPINYFQAYSYSFISENNLKTESENKLLIYKIQHKSQKLKK